MSTPDTTTTAESRELALTRVIDAPRERIFQAWTDPAILPQWWGSHGITTPVCEMDPRPGGIFRTVMRDADGNEHAGTGVFLEVVAPERVVFTDAFTPGWIPSPEPFFTCVVTLEEDGGKTRCTARALHWTEEKRAQHEEMGFKTGWGEMFERLETLVTVNWPGK